MPVHYLAVDPESRAVVLVLRGSMSLQVRSISSLILIWSLVVQHVHVRL